MILGWLLGCRWGQAHIKYELPAEGSNFVVQWGEAPAGWRPRAEDLGEKSVARKLKKSLTRKGAGMKKQSELSHKSVHDQVSKDAGPSMRRGSRRDTPSPAGGATAFPSYAESRELEVGAQHI